MTGRPAWSEAGSGTPFSSALRNSNASPAAPADLEPAVDEQRFAAAIALVEPYQHGQDALIIGRLCAVAVGLELLALAVAEDLQGLASSA